MKFFFYFKMCKKERHLQKYQCQTALDEFSLEKGVLNAIRAYSSESSKMCKFRTTKKYVKKCGKIKGQGVATL